MSDFKKLLRREVIDPAQKLNRIYTFTATVKKSENGKCDIEYTDEDGKKQNKKGVKIRVYGNETTGATSYKEGDSVIVQKDSSDDLEVIASAIDDYDAYIEQYKLKKDVYSNLVLDIMPGYNM